MCSGCYINPCGGGGDAADGDAGDDGGDPGGTAAGAAGRRGRGPGPPGARGAPRGRRRGRGGGVRRAVRRETTVATRVGPLRVRQAGGGGPTVLLVHGLLLDGRLWDGVVDALPRGGRGAVPDPPLGARPGRAPDRSVLTPEHVAGALLDVLDGVDASTAVLVGNDTGGALAPTAAAEAPGRGGGVGR